MPHLFPWHPMVVPHGILFKEALAGIDVILVAKAISTTHSQSVQIAVAHSCLARLYSFRAHNSSYLLTLQTVIIYVRDPGFATNAAYGKPVGLCTNDISNHNYSWAPRSLLLKLGWGDYVHGRPHMTTQVVLGGWHSLSWGGGEQTSGPGRPFVGARTVAWSIASKLRVHSRKFLPYISPLCLYIYLHQ